MTRQQRVARNQSVFRAANERIEESRRRLSPDGRESPFICECSDERCTAVVLVSPEDYATVRSGETRFLVASGHEGGERIVERRDGFSMVETEGEAAAWMTESSA